MPRKRVRSKLKVDKLTVPQFWSLWLDRKGYDYQRDNAAFHSDEERKEAWFNNREALMKEWRENDLPGKRPGAWWEFEAPEQPKEIGINSKYNFTVYEEEKDALRRLGLLEQWEIEELERQESFNGARKTESGAIN